MRARVLRPARGPLMRGRSQHFVTAGRAAVACLLAVSLSALVPMLRIWLALPASRSNGYVWPADPLLATAGYDTRGEASAVLVAFMFLALPMLPPYGLGMVVARRLRITHWTYFAGLGVAIAALLDGFVSWRGAVLPAPPAQHGAMVWHMPLVPGLAGGFVCWLFLWLTRARRW